MISQVSNEAPDRLQRPVERLTVFVEHVNRGLT